MSMNEWAKREIEIACKIENPERKEGEFDYGCSCYESALKAFNSLCGDGHSGFSIKMTQHILNRLINGEPLTPIEDIEGIWSDTIFRRDDKVTYQCKRMSSLFKEVYEDGTVKYHDNNRYYCVDINNPKTTYTSSLVRGIVDVLFPITMPYMPTTEPIKVYCEEFLTDKKNGDFDTVGIFYLIKDNEKTEINRFFKEGEKDWIEIDKAECEYRKAIKI